MWAILCARALWGFKPLRIPLAALSGMIILSTMTTGWHYFSDVLAGVLLAAVSIYFADLLTPYFDPFRLEPLEVECAARRILSEVPTVPEDV
jgi:membrane-associated phospholipid phosphatase